MKTILSFWIAMICATMDVNAQSDVSHQASLMFKKHDLLWQKESLTALSMNIGTAPHQYEVGLSGIEDSVAPRRKHRYDYDVEHNRLMGVVTVSIAPVVIAGGATLLGFGIRDFKRSKAAGSETDIVTYVELGVGSALMAIGIGALIDGAINISRGNRALHGKDKDMRSKKRYRHSWEY